MPSTALYSTFARADLAFERGEGVWLYTADGTAYLDMMAGIAVNSLGHAHPKLVKVLQEQAARLWHVSNVFTIPEQERLAKQLTELSFADRVFFTNSGAEAVECAIKTARRWHYSKGHGERYRIITFEGAFHGRTLATIAAGGQAKYLEGFGPKADGFDQVPFQDLDALKATVGPETAAILAEPIQGEGGIRAFDTTFLKTLRAFCDEHGLLLIFDEVQTGIGRTGKFFAHEWAGVTPDILAVAKGLGGGFPVGACLATEEAASGMVPGVHGTTFGGNLLAMAVGNAVIEEIGKPEFLEAVREKSRLMKQKLAGLVDSHPDVFEGVRGEGLLLGVKCKVPSTEVLAAMRAENLLCVGAGDNVIRFAPPLTVTAEELEEAVRRADAAAGAVESVKKA
jgi:acetylornithine/N-succinyldiaminopimelate aminotransferase